jgi:hypothetical protein
VLIFIIISLVTIYLYYMRVKQLQEKRIHVYETEENHRDEKKVLYKLI